MSLAHAILASLIDKSCSGYDLAKQFDGSLGFFWQASHQQIYRELSKLSKLGWITSEIIVQEGRPDKKNYRVTQAGTVQLKDWIAQTSEPAAIKDDLLVKIFSGYIVSEHVILQELEHHRQAHTEKLSIYRDLEQKYFPNPRQLTQVAKFQYLTLRKGIRYEAEWVEWCNEAIELLDKK
ncbi:MAG: PadR family transcriptional regulator [Cyanobacteriota bacterium]|nr:PadR family transcriptional regulator [Cyanobacteriota bacterium]